MTAEKATSDVDVLVIGGGQAGLAAGFYLNRLRRDAARGSAGPAPSFAILDARASPGGAWKDYWDSLELFSPAAYSSLPGYQMPAFPGGSNPPARHVVDYLTTYETRYDLPLRRGESALEVRAAPGGGFTVRTSRGEWSSRVVISATGTWGAPYRPVLPGNDDFTGQQLHTADYRGRDRFAGLKVIVVGGANSGAQIAADLAPVASVTWVTRKPPHYLPDEIDGHALFRIATAHARAVARGEPTPGAVASFGDIVAVPSVRKARDAGLLTALTMFSSLTPGGVRWADGRQQEADAIIWCTGFRPDLKHLDPLGLTVQDGVPATTARPTTRSADVPGLYFLGYGDWCGPASATLIGVGVMARDTVTDAHRQLGETRATAAANSPRNP